MSNAPNPDWNNPPATEEMRPPMTIHARAASTVVWGIAALLVCVHGYRTFTIPAGSWQDAEYIVRFALIPLYVPENPIALITHMGVHGGWLHLAMNVAFFLMLGLVVARRLGSDAWAWVKILTLTSASGLGGAAGVMLINPESEVATVGFSGAVCGIAAVFLLSQRLDWRDALRDRSVQSAALWFLALNVGAAWAVSTGGLISISWEAHLGGFIAGAVCWMALAPRVPSPR